jgi:beta-glucanase (GH16 family)
MRFQINGAVKALAAVASVAVLASIAQAPATAATRKLLWSEEFNAKKVSGISTKNWDYDLGDGYGWGNSEQEYYTKDRANIRVNGKGQLEIVAKRIPNDSMILDRCFTCQFTSAKIKTAGRLGFKYGRLEARMKLPAGKGTWPAFWMLGTSWRRPDRDRTTPTEPSTDLATLEPRAPKRVPCSHRWKAH